MAAELLAGADTAVRVVVLPSLSSASGHRRGALGREARQPRPVDLGGVGNDNVMLFCHAAHSLLTPMAERVFSAPATLEPHEVDRGPRDARKGDWSAAASAMARWEDELEDMALLGRRLVSVIDAISPANPDKGYLAGWAGRVFAPESPGTELVPVSLRGAKGPL